MTLFFGDLGTFSMLPFFVTTGFFIAISQAKKNQKPARFFNLMLIFAAVRCVFVFAEAFENLMSTGLIMMLFGALVLGMAALFAMKKQQVVSFLERNFDR